MSHKVTQNYSTVVVNQNQAVDPLIASGEWSGYIQEFHLPADYRRGTESGELRYPALSGVQLFVMIAEGFARYAAFDYELQYQVFGLGWVSVYSGVAIGAPTDGQVWMTGYFDEPVAIDAVKATARWRIIFGSGGQQDGLPPGTPLGGTDDTRDVIVAYSNGEANVLGTRVVVDLIAGEPYHFIHNGRPAFLYLDPNDSQVYFSYEQGIERFLFTTPNPLALPNFDQAYDHEGNILVGTGDVPAAFNFRILALAAEDGVDFLGNEYRSVVVQNEPDAISTALGSDPDAYWLSKPNPSKFAVESLYFDVRRAASTSYDHVNLVQDPGFEGRDIIYMPEVDGGQIGEYFMYAGAAIDPNDTLQVDYVEGRDGTGRALHMKRTTGTNNVGIGWTIDRPSFIRGVPHVHGAWIKATAGTTILMYCDYLVSGVYGSQQYITVATGDWQYLWWTFNVPADSNSGSLYIWMNLVDSTNDLYIDDVTVWQGTTQPYPLEGSMDGAVWTGVPYYSPSAELTPPSADDVSTVIDRVLVDPITPGSYFTIYYTEEGDPGLNEPEWENKLWMRVPQTYRMERRETHVLPEPIKAKYLKIEFSHLQAQYYAPGDFQQAIRYKKHPKWVLDYFLARMQTDAAFLSQRVTVVYDALDLAYNYYLDDLGQEPQTSVDVNVTAAAQIRTFLSDRSDVSDRIDPVTLEKVNLVLNPYRDHPALRGYSQTILGDWARQTVDPLADYSVEGQRVGAAPTSDVSSLNRDRVVIEQNYPVMFFYLTSRHKYREVEARFTHDRAYFVGVRQIAFLRDNYMTAYDTGTYIEAAADTQNIERNEFM